MYLQIKLSNLRSLLRDREELISLYDALEQAKTNLSVLDMPSEGITGLFFILFT